MAVQIQFRRGLASEWTSANPVLAVAEMGIETNTGQFKIGNGSTAWNSLPYGGIAGAAGPAGATGPAGERGPAGTGDAGTISSFLLMGA